MFKIKYTLQEEEEGGGGGGGGYCFDLPESLTTLNKWWAEVIKGIGYFPVYAVIISSELNKEVYALIDSCRDEISNISGTDCCFVYFREYESAKDLKVWSFREHKKYASRFGTLLGLEGANIVFFSLACLEPNSDRKDMVVLPLKNKSAERTLEELHILFKNYYSLNDKCEPLEQLKVGANKVLQKHVIDEVATYARQGVSAFFKNIGKVVIGVLG